MTEQINWNLNAQVVGGPKILASDKIEIEAYDKIEVTIEAGASDKEVQIQPGGAGQVQFLLIKSEHYGDALTYKVNDTTDVIKLDALQMLMGNGAIELLDVLPPEKLLFSNALVSSTGENIPASVEILVGRKATT
ncbi:MAG: hypothetical protein KAJ03_06435 [Gammaproteobacteria bacterium]|nr:hypothetical protein [Gammaproteobacteria bacterium]